MRALHSDGTVETLENGRGPRFLTKVHVHIRILPHLCVVEQADEPVSEAGGQTARSVSNPAAPTIVDLSHPHGWPSSYKDVRIYEVSLTA